MKKLINLLLLASMVLGGILMPASVNVGSSYPDNINFNIQVAEAQNDFTNTSLTAECDSSWDVACHIGNILLWYFDLIWYKTTQVFAFLSGFILDVLLYHSISSATYRTGIIESGWEILRDFVNIVFIFSLLFIAFKMVFGAGSKAKAYLIKTILVALVINFSLFITYTVMDSSNLLANIFYSRISTDGQVNSQSELSALDEFFSEQSRRSPSAAIVNNFNPQIIVQKIQGNIGFFQRFLMVFAAGAINIMMIWVFVSIILLFLGRTVGLILSAIMAPIAFATLTVPSSGATNLPYVGFNTWIKELLSLSFMAPIYLFFLYLIVEFAKDDALFNSISIAGNTGDGAGNVINLIIGVLLPFGLIGFLLETARRITKKMSGELGGKIAGGVTKLAVGAATVAGAGLAIAATGGLAAAGGAARLAGAKGSRLNNFGRMLQTKKFDISKIPGFKGTLGKNAFASRAAGALNTSYADVDTKARKGYMNIKDSYDGFKSGRTPKSVQKWEENIQNEKDKLASEKINDKNRSDKVLNDEKDRLAELIKEKNEAQADKTGKVAPITTTNSEVVGVLNRLIANDSRFSGLDNASIGGKTDMNLEQQKALDDRFKELIDIERGRAKNGLSSAEAVESLVRAQKEFSKQTFEGKVKEKEKDIENRKQKNKNEVAEEIQNKGDKTTADRIRRGEIKESTDSRDTDKNK